MEETRCSDARLVTKSQSGDAQAFDELVARHYDRVYRLAAARLGDADEAYDVAQDVFLRAFKALPTFRRDAAFYTWVYRVTRNVCADYARRRLPMPIDMPEALPGSPLPSTACVTTVNPVDDLLRGELQAKVRDAVSRLPERQREVFELRHSGDMKLVDIANRLDRSVGTVKAHLSHARARLHRLLLPYWDEPSAELAVD